jgi:hypothetical protein
MARVTTAATTNEQTTMVLQQSPNRLCLGRFLNAVANLKLLMGSPDSLDHAGAKAFYHCVVILAVATGVLGPRLTPWDIASVMLAAEDALHSEFDAYEDCFDDEAAVVPPDLLDVKDQLAAWAHAQRDAVTPRWWLRNHPP